MTTETLIKPDPLSPAGVALKHMDEQVLSKLVLNGDLAPLNPQQKVDYYIYRARASGLDPATKPFDVLKLNGKEVLYATKECSSQLSSLHKLSATVVSDGVVGDIYRVVARATSPDGRCTDDLGCVTIKGLSGDSLCNAMMKATTKAKRRAILTHCGLGMLDESEIETIPKERAPERVKRAPVSKEKPAATAERASETAPAPNAAGEGSPEPSSPSDPIDSDMKSTFAKILRVHKKEGVRANKQPYIKYSLQVDSKELGNGAWISTFSKTLGEVAQECVGTSQTLLYSVSQWNGNDQYDLESIER